MAEAETKSAHTAGEWRAWESPAGGWTVRAVYMDGGLRHTSFVAVCNASLQNNEANARLIAAAPDLLAALKDVVASVEGWSGYNDDGFDGAQMAMFRAAISRAEA